MSTRTTKELVTFFKTKAANEFVNADKLQRQAKEHEAAGRAYQEAAEKVDEALAPKETK